jgi:small-conductance mechanosensitive channel
MKAQLSIIGYQVVFVIIAAVLALSLFPEQLGLKGVLYGGSISIIAASIMAYRINQATRKILEGNQRGSLYLYLGVIERLCIAIALFAMGFMWLKLSPVPMVSGLIAGQVGFMLGGFRVKD